MFKKLLHLNFKGTYTQGLEDGKNNFAERLISLGKITEKDLDEIDTQDLLWDMKEYIVETTQLTDDEAYSLVTELFEMFEISRKAV